VLQFRFQEILQPISTSAPTWDVCVFPEDDDDADSKYAAVFPHSFQRVGGYVGNAFQEREREGERSKQSCCFSLFRLLHGRFVCSINDLIGFQHLAIEVCGCCIWNSIFLRTHILFQSLTYSYHFLLLTLKSSSKTQAHQGSSQQVPQLIYRFAHESILVGWVLLLMIRPCNRP